MERVAPWLFVVLWSSGFVAAHYSTEDAGPFTFLAVRFALAASLLWLIAAITGAPPISRPQVTWASIASVGMQVMYLGGVFFAIAHGLPAGLSALIAGLHPVVTSVAGRWLLGERLRRVQWLGIAVGIAGVVVVVVDKFGDSSHGVSTTALIAMIVSVIGIAGGTLVQRARGGSMPLLRGTAVQYTTAMLVLLVAAIFNEHWRIRFTGREWFSLGWAVLLLSMGSVLIMLRMLQRESAARVTSLFFLTPALSAVEGAILLGEHLAGLTIVGLVISLVGVALTTRPALPGGLDAAIPALES